MASKVTVDFKASDMTKKMEQHNKIVLSQITREVNKDMNPYVPKRTGALERSSLNNSIYNKGLIIYNTQYARKLFYNPTGVTFNRSINSKATERWDLAAKKDNVNKWVRLYGKLTGKTFDGK